MFHSFLDARQVGVWERRTVWQLIHPLLATAYNGFLRMEAPCNFYTDFASVPRHFGLYEKFGGIGNKEAVIHDLGYRKGSSLVINFSKKNDSISDVINEWAEEYESCAVMGNKIQIYEPPREIWDNIFKQLLIEEGQPSIIHDVMFQGVRLGGGSSYHCRELMDCIPCEKWDSIKPNFD